MWNADCRCPRPICAEFPARAPTPWNDSSDRNRRSDPGGAAELSEQVMEVKMVRQACVWAFVALGSAVAVGAQTVGDTGDINLPKIPNPLQIEGLKVKTRIPFAEPGDRPVFQQIVPCRLVDTRPTRSVGGATVAEFAPPYGGPIFHPGDSRTYTASGPIQDPAGTPTNPCTIKARIAAGDPDAKEIPRNLVGLALRVVAINRSDSSPAAAIVTVSPSEPAAGSGGL